MRIAVLGSGKGSNFDAIVRDVERNNLDIDICCVLSDAADAPILEKARLGGFDARHISAGNSRFSIDEKQTREYISILEQARPDLIVLAGFMRIVPRAILNCFENRVLNIHPSLLPAFPGLQAWKQALDYGVKVTGCTVHFVDEGIDTGAIILQETVPVKSADTAQSLHARIQRKEHRLYPKVIKLFAEGKVEKHGRKVIVKA